MDSVQHIITARPITKMDGATIGYRFSCSCGREGKGRHPTFERALERGRDHILPTNWITVSVKSPEI